MIGDLSGFGVSSSVEALDVLRDQASPLPTPGARGESFASILSRARDGLDQMTPEEKARASAEEFVAQALVLPVLKQMRETNDAWGPFAPGRHEKRFGSMLDGEIASRLVRAQRFPLVERLAQDMLKHRSRTESGLSGAVTEDS